jgi:membrane-associated phospholipid phosphatase
MDRLLSFELLVLGYCFGMVAAGAATQRPGARALALAGAVTAVVLIAASGRLEAIRSWLPHGYLVAGYWIPALMVDSRRGELAAPTRFEGWLRRIDGACRARLPDLPAVVAMLAELAYLFCYPLVPLSFVVIWLQGSPADVGRFWLSVLGAGCACYASLPWLLSRPPRIAAPSGSSPAGVRMLNVFLLDRVSHGWITFPSGHVAVAFAAAWSVAHVSAPMGAVIGVVAAAVAAGAIAGGYHYAIDVAAGLAVAAAAAMIVW